jgi:hypothetical protein
VTTEAAIVAVPLVEITEDPDVYDALVVREASVPELEEVEDEMPDALLAEIDEAEVTDDEELTGELIAPAICPASEL